MQHKLTEFQFGHNAKSTIKMRESYYKFNINAKRELRVCQSKSNTGETYPNHILIKN